MFGDRSVGMAAWALCASSALAAGPSASATSPATPATPARATTHDHLPREGLIAHWPADGDANDRAGANHGAMLNGARFAPGKLGQAFRFDGNGAHLATPSTGILSTVGAFTVSMWVHASGDGTLLTKGVLFADQAPRGQNSYCLQVAVHEDEGRRVRVTAVGGRGAYAEPAHAALTERPLGKGRWYHLAVVFDAGALAVYLDGVHEPARITYYRHAGEGWPSVDTPQIDKLATAAAVVRVGCAWSHRNRTSEPEDSFVGLIDDVAVWDRALRADEIQRIWMAGELGAAPGWPAAPSVRRAADADRIVMADGTVHEGTLQRGALKVRTDYGQIALDLGDVVGLLKAKDTGTAWVLLNQGQAVLGEVDLGELSVDQTSGGALRVLWAQVAEVSRRAEPNAPAGAAPAAGTVFLRTGERLQWRKLTQPLRLRTPYGPVELPAERLGGLRIGESGDRWQARLAGGTVLAGILEPNALAVQLALGAEVSIPLDRLAGLTAAVHDPAGPEAAVLQTRTGDWLFGELRNKALAVKTSSGATSVHPAGILSLAADANRPNEVRLRLWDDTELHGELGEESLAFELTGGGPVLVLKPAAVASVTRSTAVPAPEMLAEIERLVKQLGADSYVQREAATEALTKMGVRIAPLLRRHANDPDAEVRNRIEVILRAVGAGPGRAPPAPAPEREPLDRRAGWRGPG